MDLAQRNPRNFLHLFTMACRHELRTSNDIYCKDDMLLQIDHNSDLFLRRKQLEYYFERLLHELETKVFAYLGRKTKFSYQFERC